MPRQSDGTTEDVRVRATPDEAQMVRDIAAQLNVSGNRAARWALRYAWQHATSTTDHGQCGPNSPCAGATRGIAPSRQRSAAPTVDQLTITHSATVEDTKS